MSMKDNKALIRRFHDRLNTKDFESLDKYLTEDYISHNVWENREGFLKVVTSLKAAYSDAKLVIEDIIAEDDKVVVRAKINSTDKTISSIAIYRIENGKIAEHWAHSDSFF